jgi:hypothetical protein
MKIDPFRDANPCFFRRRKEGPLRSNRRPHEGRLRRPLSVLFVGVAVSLPTPGDHITAYAEAAVNDLNHRHRPCLNGRTSCEAFFVSADRRAFTKWERR